jgi:hypothetical protein
MRAKREHQIRRQNRRFNRPVTPIKQSNRLCAITAVLGIALCEFRDCLAQ